MCLAGLTREPLYRYKKVFFLRWWDGEDKPWFVPVLRQTLFCRDTRLQPLFFPFLFFHHHHKNVSCPYLVVTLESVMWGRRPEKSKSSLNPQTTAGAPVESHTALLLHFPPDQSWLGLNIQPRFCITQTQFSFKQECLHFSSSGSG